MNFFLIINDDQYFGPPLLKKLFESGEIPGHVVICSRFSEETPFISRAKYLFVMALTLNPVFSLKFSCVGLFKRFGLAPKIDIEDILNDYSISYSKYKNVNDPKLLELLNNTKANIGLSICSQIYSKNTLENLNMPLFNFHGGTLPMNRGRYPFFWTIALGLENELCVHKIEPHIDQGHILLRIKLEKTHSLAKATCIYASALPLAIQLALNKLRSGHLNAEITKPGRYRQRPGILDIFKYWGWKIKTWIS